MKRKERERRKKRSLNSNFLISVIFSFILILSLCWNSYAEEASAGDIEALKRKFIDLMNKWASFRWGLNSLVYVLYYDPTILKPWVELNASLNKWDESEKRSFEDSVKSALQLGKAAAFLITIENIGKKPFSIAPLSKNLVLKDSKGREYHPIKFEPQLESSVNGKVQGLVFFPKLPKDAGRITLSIKGLPDGAMSFSWILSTSEKERLAKEERKRVISWEELAKASSSRTEKKGPKEDKKAKGEVKVVKPKAQIKTVIKPTPPKKPVKPEVSSKPLKVKLPSPPKSKKALHKKGVEKIPVKLLPIKKKEETDLSFLKGKVKEIKVFDPQGVLKDYIEAWKEGNYRRMYSLLSIESRKKISFLRFKRLVKEGPPSWIKEGKYKLLPPKKTKRGTRITLVASVKLGFIKIIQTKSFYFVLEKEGWRIRF
ncbi:MAG: hypothetical protein J7M13_04660 [Synergistetes bacterium]|nr:hypothetical protein [Synergistota bacterium]